MLRARATSRQVGRRGVDHADFTTFLPSCASDQEAAYTTSPPSPDLPDPRSPLTLLKLPTQKRISTRVGFTNWSREREPTARRKKTCNDENIDFQLNSSGFQYTEYSTVFLRSSLQHVSLLATHQHSHWASFPI